MSTDQTTQHDKGNLGSHTDDHMSHHSWNEQMRASWNAIADEFQSRHYGSDLKLPAGIEYGPFAPPEAELQLLGSLRGRSVLDIGCGGGRNAILLAKRGALVTGVDVSDRQLEIARRLAQQEDAHVRFIQASASNLHAVATASIDIALAVYSLHYLSDMNAALQAIFRTLRPRGQLVISIDHPIRTCFYEQQDDEQIIFPVRSYFDLSPIRWRFPDTDVHMTSRHDTIDQWVTQITGAGYQLQRILEPRTPDEILDYHYPQDSALAPLRHLPHTLILMAIKPA